MRVGRRSLVVLAGVPGAGKTTALAKLRADADVAVLDSEQVRGRLRHLVPARLPYRWYRPLVHVLHRSRIAWSCLSRSGPVLAHEPATRATTRGLLLLVAVLTRRQRVLVWLHADPREALAGQRVRGRLIRPRSFLRHARRAERVHRLLRAGRRPRGWRNVLLLTRDDVVDGFRLETAE